jgi:3-oxoadipate enol-lactonase
MSTKQRTITTGHYVTNDGAWLYYEMRGAGPPVVLVAELGDDVASWEPIERLADSHLMVTFDNRGVGRSSIPPGPYSIEQMADDASALVRRLGLRPVAAVGYSMGGAICQRWALRHPRDVACLVLTNTWADPDPDLDVLFALWSAIARTGDGRRLLDAVGASCFSSGWLASLDDETLAELKATEPPPLDGFVPAAAACRAHDALGELAAIAQPALVIAGEQDEVTPPALAWRLAERLPNAELRTLDTGHASYWERPDEWLELVRDFLGGRIGTNAASEAALLT